VAVDSASTHSFISVLREWDALPGFKGAPTDWSPNGRLVLIELMKRPGILRASIVLGPGPQKDRENIFKIAKDADIGVPGRTAYEQVVYL